MQRNAAWLVIVLAVVGVMGEVPWDWPLRMASPERAILEMMDEYLQRLSVDIDLVYLPIADRETSLVAIRQALGRTAQASRRLSNQVFSVWAPSSAR